MHNGVADTDFVAAFQLRAAGVIQVGSVRVGHEASSIHEGAVGTVQVENANRRRVHFEQAVMARKLTSLPFFFHANVAIVRATDYARLRAIKSVMGFIVAGGRDVEGNAWELHGILLCPDECRARIKGDSVPQFSGCLPGNPTTGPRRPK